VARDGRVHALGETHGPEEEAAANARLIAAAVNALPALLDRLEAAEAERDAARSALPVGTPGTIAEGIRGILDSLSKAWLAARAASDDAHAWAQDTKRAEAEREDAEERAEERRAGDVVALSGGWLG
jgi:hypothetical protein